MPPRRHELLEASRLATDIIEKHPLSNRLSFDVVGLMIDLDIPLLYKPLKGLWGAVITVDPDRQGVLVTTKLPLSVQRFTLAHELGHVLLGHQVSFDETVGFAGRFGTKQRSTQEIAADTFASELLAHRKLMLAAAVRHQWDKSALLRPQKAYQLALRLGISYQALCWALAASKIASFESASAMARAEVKPLKRELLPPDLQVDPWADVWELTEGDSGAQIEASLNDTFVVRLREMASTGFVWQLVDSGMHSRVVDERITLNKGYDSEGGHTLSLQFDAPGNHRLLFEQIRPWNRNRLAHVDIAIDNYGKELGGFARRRREFAVAAAS